MAWRCHKCLAEVGGVEITMVLHLPRDAVSVPVSRRVLDGCLQTLGVTPDTRADIALALSEACANVILHAGTGQEYQVQVSARNGCCVIEVINAGSWNGAPARDGSRPAVTGQPVPATAEHGRGLTIIDAVTDNLQLTGSERNGTTVHFEKTLQWLPDAPGQHLLNTENGNLPLMEITRNVGDTIKAPAGRFAGDVWMWAPIGATQHTEVRVVLFTPGARTAWHRHPAGQVLHVTEGRGLVQSRGGERAEIRAGDAVTAAPGEWHWHGAAPAAFMVHLAVSDGTTEWGEQVTDDEYQGFSPSKSG
jgi:quercetin dioxygenase-like cupin family protein/anti-sigma regulatory factor (Ser/Thr protein kinase)